MLKKKYYIDINRNRDILSKLIKEIADIKEGTYENILKVIQKNPSADKSILSKSQIISSYAKLKKDIELTDVQENNFLKNIRMKKIRTISGVTPVTVLTKPFPCPGKCIFCPNDVRMPKSYMADEPGAQRAEANKFDPYFQTFNRLVAYKNMGHPIEKVELIILGGTWSHYPEKYQIWFVKRCFDALNDFGSYTGFEPLAVSTKDPIDKKLLKEIRGESMKESYNRVIVKALTSKITDQQNEKSSWDELEKAHIINKDAICRCVGLVFETRPDEINKDELIRIRKLGGTKIQIGIQSLNDKVLSKNKRGHNVITTRNAVNMIRLAGFKIHAHWMPNLLGSTPKKDIADFKKLFSDISIRPDELKVYPCSLIGSAELMQYYKRGEWLPYSEEDLKIILYAVFINTPRYCRLTRIIRDIPSTDIVVGNKISNLRQIVERDLNQNGILLRDIRAREIKDIGIDNDKLIFKNTYYKTSVSKEYFLEFTTETDQIVAFARLSLPHTSIFDELTNSAIIREVHVYGQSLELGERGGGKAQHSGLGKNLMAQAEKVAKNNGYNKISVISAVGTRNYYKNLGYSFSEKELYQHKNI